MVQIIMSKQSHKIDFPCFILELLLYKFFRLAVAAVKKISLREKLEKM